MRGVEDDRKKRLNLDASRRVEDAYQVALSCRVSRRKFEAGGEVATGGRQNKAETRGIRAAKHCTGCPRARSREYSGGTL